MIAVEAVTLRHHSARIADAPHQLDFGGSGREDGVVRHVRRHQVRHIALANVHRLRVQSNRLRCTSLVISSICHATRASLLYYLFECSTPFSSDLVSPITFHILKLPKVILTADMAAVRTIANKLMRHHGVQGVLGVHAALNEWLLTYGLLRVSLRAGIGPMS